MCKSYISIRQPPEPGMLSVHQREEGNQEGGARPGEGVDSSEGIYVTS